MHPSAGSHPEYLYKSYHTRPIIHADPMHMLSSPNRALDLGLRRRTIRLEEAAAAVGTAAVCAVHATSASGLGDVLLA